MFKRILVPVDGSIHAKKAMEAAVSLLDKAGEGASLTVLHVFPILSLNEAAMVDLNALMEKEGRTILDDVREQLSGSAFPYELKTAHGDPAFTICDWAEKGSFELIVIGSRGLGRFSELVLGSVSHNVTQHSPCPVMIVK